MFRINNFRANFESEDVEPREGGSAFAAYYKGKQVVNLWGGYADYESGQPWREDTMAIVASVTKGRLFLGFSKSRVIRVETSVW